MNPSIQKIIANAQKLIKQGNRQAARQLLGQAVRDYPREAYLWFWLGQTLDDRKHALDAFQRALSYDPTLHQAQKFIDLISTSSAPKAPPVKASPPPPPPPPKKEELPESDVNLDWLMNRTDPAPAMSEPQKPKPQPSKASPQKPKPQAPKASPQKPNEQIKAPPPLTQQHEGSSWSFLEELSEDDFQIDIEPPAEKVPDKAKPPASSGSSFLQELEQSKPLAAQKAESSEDPWGFLTDELVSSNVEGAEALLATPQHVEQHPSGINENQLWRRAEAFIGEVKLPELLLAENQGAKEAQIEPGVFSFSDATISLAAKIPVRSHLAPLTEAEIRAALGIEPAKSEADKEEPQKESQPRRGRGLLGCLLLLIILPLLLAAVGWYLLTGTFYPTSLEEVKELNPAVISTQVAELEVRYLTTPATPIPAPDWVAEAQELRYQNNFAEAEERLRAGLGAERNVIALATLSDLLRERLGREGEALTLAQEASTAATTAEEQARATESYVWAMAYQPQADVTQAGALAEQALADTSESPHAFWALAMARALNGDADGCREALISASALSGKNAPPGEVAAKEAALYARLGKLEEAVQLYEVALQGADYIPWRVELVKIERQLEHPDTQIHLEHLRTIAPDDPAVQQLGQ